MGIRLLLLPSVVLLVAACGDDSSGGANIMVRVQNDRAEAIEIRIGPADYGQVDAGAVTDYQEVGNCENDVVVNGETGDPAEFCCATGGFEEFCNGRWTYFVYEMGGGLSSDDFGPIEQ